MMVIAAAAAVSAAVTAIRHLRHIAYIISIHNKKSDKTPDHNMATRRVIGIGSISLNPGCHHLHMLSLAYGGGQRSHPHPQREGDVALPVRNHPATDDP